MKKILIATFSLGLVFSLSSIAGASLITEVEPNDPLFSAQDIDGDFSVGAEAGVTENIVGLGLIPWVSIQGSGNDTAIPGADDHEDTYDYYSFTAEAGSTGWFDIDFGVEGGYMDAEIALWDSTGNLLDWNDDASTSLGEGGSTSTYDSFLEFDFLTTGTYYIGVAEYDAGGVYGGWSSISNSLEGDGLDTYTLQVSLAGPSPVPEPATMLLFGTGLSGLAFLGRRRKKS